ncbi:hypothetical protein PSRA_0179 [Pseudoscardovia radai]|uniref:DUF4097 domain-containing protein n=1 Tax=Pseudoscardovia radai TaxID=987066 RepID=A0A261F2M6_9BIFI|nr:DUF4097 family beta strand repeat-containing protein [Pseudoscardovia radai]OZG53372.1 hypothetical protein PSRA_0179 [Pseudoscardovia radai]
MGLEYVEYPVTEIERVEVNCKLFAIRVMGSATDNIELSWRDTTMRSLEVKQEGNTLKLIDHAAIGIYGTLALINLKKDDQLLIKLPESFTGKAIIQSRSESVHLSDLKFPGSLGVSSDAGEILLENVETAKIDIRGNLCKVNCYGVGVTETMDISSKTGQIQCYVDGTEEEYSVFCNTERKRHVTAVNRSNPRRPGGIWTNAPERLGHGPRKVCITTETGQIDFAFQNGVKTRKTAGRYRHGNSFQDW